MGIYEASPPPALGSGEIEHRYAAAARQEQDAIEQTSRQRAWTPERRAAQSKRATELQAKLRAEREGRNED
jgi:hypothetical protein